MKTIQEAARDYCCEDCSEKQTCNKTKYECCMLSGYYAFIAGAEYRKTEIDELIDLIKSLLNGIEGFPAMNAIAGTLDKQYTAAERMLKKYGK